MKRAITKAKMILGLFGVGESQPFPKPVKKVLHNEMCSCGNSSCDRKPFVHDGALIEFGRHKTVTVFHALGDEPIEEEISKRPAHPAYPAMGSGFAMQRYMDIKKRNIKRVFGKDMSEHFIRAMTISLIDEDDFVDWCILEKIPIWKQYIYRIIDRIRPENNFVL